MKRHIHFLMAAALVWFTACSGKETAKQDKSEDDLPVVRIQQVGLQTVDQLATFTASIEAENVNNISASMANRIKAIYVDEGMGVSKGQKLVLLDDINTTSYEAQVDNAKAQLKLAQTDYNRAVELLKIGGGTQQTVDQMQIQLVNAKNALTTAERTLRNARENTLLTSPVSGYVTARNYDPGDMTGQAPILTIAQIQPVKAVINVSESDYSRVHKGMVASLTLEAYGDRVFTGKVSMISPAIDTQTRTFGVEVTLPNANGEIRPGMFGRVTLNLGQAERVVVPDKAVVKQPGSGNQFVYVYKDGHVTYNKVVIGQRIGTSYELISGVPEQAEVVVAGQAKLTDGAAVTVADK